MNYFAHGVRFLDRPYFVAGTALPDWLSVADRRCRLRAKRVAPFADGSATPESELASGIVQHLDDDSWFHNTFAFHVVTGELTRLFREALPADEGYRPAFLGHIVAELVLDGVLIARDPRALDDYYAALGSVDPLRIEAAVNRMVKLPTERLAGFIRLFQRARFLEDYAQPARLLFRLNQVLQRVTLQPLPHQTTGVLESAWSIVEHHADELLAGFEPSPSPPLRVRGPG